MTKRDSLNAQGCLCMERDMPNRCLKRSYLRGTLMGRKCAFLQCSAGRWPKLCQSDNHRSAQHEDSFCSQISQGRALFSWTGFFLKLIDWKKKRKKVCFKGKVFLFCVSSEASQVMLSGLTYSTRPIYLNIRQWCIMYTRTHLVQPVFGNLKWNLWGNHCVYVFICCSSAVCVKAVPG